MTPRVDPRFAPRDCFCGVRHRGASGGGGLALLVTTRSAPPPLTQDPEHDRGGLGVPLQVAGEARVVASLLPSHLLEDQAVPAQDQPWPRVLADDLTLQIADIKVIQPVFLILTGSIPDTTSLCASREMGASGAPILLSASSFLIYI